MTERPFDNFYVKLGPGLRAPVHKELIGRSLLVTPTGVLNLTIPHEVPVFILENGFERFVDVRIDALEQGGHATGDYAANYFVMSGET